MRTRQPIVNTRRLSPKISPPLLPGPSLSSDHHLIGGANADCLTHNIYDAMQALQALSCVYLALLYDSVTLNSPCRLDSENQPGSLSECIEPPNCGPTELGLKRAAPLSCEDGQPAQKKRKRNAK
jgi:hypothetical protein